MKISIQILLAFLLVLLLSTFDTTSNYLLSLKVERNTDFLNRSQEVIRNSNSLHKAIIDMQSSLKSFLLTSDSSFLDDFKAGVAKFPELVQEQKNFVKNEWVQHSLINSIESKFNKWVALTNRYLNSPDSLSQQFLLNNAIEKKINHDINSDFAAFNKIEYASRTMHRTNLVSSINTTHTFSLLFYALTLLVGVAAALFIVKRTSKRINQMVLLAENISRGNFTVIKDDQKDELTNLSSSLNTMSSTIQKNINDLENKNTELDKFANVVSHDLKAPLRGIHNVLQWIEEDLGSELSTQMKKYLNIIRQRLKRMEDLINGLLDYARVRRRSAPEQINVRNLVQDLVNEMVPRSFSVVISDLPVIFTERLKLEQVFANLISNAVKYSSSENGHVAISSREFETFYEFSVKDNGIGIDPEYHSRIFEMFQTLREKNEQESTGIGLAITKKILDENGSNIRVVSALNEGTEFVFTWPKNKPDHD